MSKSHNCDNKINHRHYTKQISAHTRNLYYSYHNHHNYHLERLVEESPKNSLNMTPLTDNIHKKSQVYSFEDGVHYNDTTIIRMNSMANISSSNYNIGIDSSYHEDRNLLALRKNNFTRRATTTLLSKPSAFYKSIIKINSLKEFLNYNHHHHHRHHHHHYHHHNKSNTTIIFFIITYLAGIILSNHQVYSLNCYHCSSVDNPNCDESFSGKDNFTLPVDTDCYKHIGREAKVCRKIVQYIEHKKVVIRSCGYIDETQTSPANQQQLAAGNEMTSKEKKPMCYKRSGTFAIMMESCNCYTDNCNHSTSLKPTQSILFLSSFLIIVAAYSLFFNHQHYHARA